MITTNKVKEKVRMIACEYFNMPEEEFDEERDFIDEYNFDSLDFFGVINQIEEEFDIDLEVDEITEINTFKKLISYIEKRLISKE